VQLGQERIARLERLQVAQRAALKDQFGGRHKSAAGDAPSHHADQRMPGEGRSTGKDTRLAGGERRGLNGGRECDLVRAGGQRLAEE
jgi:hypothetical protein